MSTEFEELLPHHGMLNENNEVVRISFRQYLDFEGTSKHIGHDKIGLLTVSTVFLGMEHPGGMWFETMIIGGEANGGFAAAEGEEHPFQERYATYDEAMAGHKKACEMARGALPVPEEKPLLPEKTDGKD